MLVVTILWKVKSPLPCLNGLIPDRTYHNTGYGLTTVAVDTSDHMFQFSSTIIQPNLHCKCPAVGVVELFQFRKNKIIVKSLEVSTNHHQTQIPVYLL